MGARGRKREKRDFKFDVSAYERGDETQISRFGRGMGLCLA
jgi:hypothetical protein